MLRRHYVAVEYMVMKQRSSRRPIVDYFPPRARPQVFYTTAIYQKLHF